MGAMKEFDIRIRNGGDDAIAAVGELTAHLEAEIERLRLTHAELEAVNQAAIRVEALCQRGSQHMAATMRGLLERLTPTGEK